MTLDDILKSYQEAKKEGRDNGLSCIMLAYQLGQGDAHKAHQEPPPRLVDKQVTVK